jgi:thymidylate synthase
MDTLKMLASKPDKPTTALLISPLEKARVKNGYYRLTDGESLSEVTYTVLAKLNGLTAEQASRAGNTKELSPHQFHIGPGIYGEPDPTTILPRRGNNVFATIAETLWVYAGRKDIETLGKWLPRAKEYSDDGTTWTSAYGPRLRAWIDHNFKIFDQIEMVVRRLREKPETRQAVIVLWDPASDGQKERSLDYVCNICLHFLIREGGLNMFVTTRSNDIIFGVAINVFEWCFLGNYIADCLNIPFRNYYQTGSSLHLYDWKSDTAKKILDWDFLPLPYLELAPKKRYPRSKLAPAQLKELCEEIFLSAYRGDLDALPLGYPDRLTSRLSDCFFALRAESRLLESSATNYLSALSGISYPPLLLSLLDIGQRRRKEPLWLANGFENLWKDTKNEGLAGQYLRKLADRNEIKA